MKTQHFCNNEKSSYLTNKTVRQWFANCGLQSNCGPSNTYWDSQHLLLWAAWYVTAEMLRRLRGIKHRLL